jgi:hypothetical protein
MHLGCSHFAAQQFWRRAAGDYPVSGPTQPASPAGEQTQTSTDLSAYRGCWVALVGDQVAGVGATAEAARLAAHHSRPRERISAVFRVPDQA